MQKVDPMEIMLSDIFDKVFYSREKKPDYCWDCDGEGTLMWRSTDLTTLVVT